MIGITSYGAYIPRLRLSRSAIFQAVGWFAPAVMAVAQGERSMCNWDEDSITMAVAASRDCLTGQKKETIDAMFLASTTLPFADRSNAGIVSTALNLRENIFAADVTSTQKAGTSALVSALDSLKGGDKSQILVAASDKRETKAAYFYEMWFGDGAAALLLGKDNVIAEYLGSYSISCDFVPHYRGELKRFDYTWEERWIRDEGYSKIIPQAVSGLMQKLNFTMNDVDKFIFPCFFKAEHKKIAQTLGADKKLIDNLHEACGETGTAHPLMMLVSALETAKPGDRILVAGFGQGCDALYFKVTEEIQKLSPRKGFKGHLSDKKTIHNYEKWLVFRELISKEMGIRAEAPTQTALTTLYRKRKMLLGLVGGKCRECQTPQFPKMDICVNPKCGAVNSQDDYEFSNIKAKIKTFTGDMLAVSLDPPQKYGMIQFEGGGRFMADFTDCELDDLKVGLPVEMAFRIRTLPSSSERGFTNYFWKAIPIPQPEQAVEIIRFDGRVAIITGAGGGLGRQYALDLAKRGAKVVVNDYGGSRDGSGTGSASPAEKVVQEIKNLGGEAVANYDNVATVEGGEHIVKTAMDTFGRVDIVINNAGILRDKSFTKMEPENWYSVIDVHLNGAYHVTRPAFKVMKENGYGRILFTTSAAGLYGNFGQTNYSSAKMALVGFMNALKIEGMKSNIKVNTIAPLAGTRLTEDIMPPDVFAKMKPEYVSPMVLYLCSDECKETGAVFNVGMGYANRVCVMTGQAVNVGNQEQLPTPETIQEHWEKINSLKGAKEYFDLNTAMIGLFTSPPAEEKQVEHSSAKEGLSVEGIFEMMPKSFNPEAAAGVAVVFQYEIAGDGGGSWIVTIHDKTCKVEKGKSDNPTCTLKIAAPDYI
ncbi:MAG: SDR family NAD(P)-dependent oxidoreductase, partial [Desulfobacterales bacterium]|nr:SDR family NAD(P)-dependent oxidoreductase [Desulfobacterales bacterium]